MPLTASAGDLFGGGLKKIQIEKNIYFKILQSYFYFTFTFFFFHMSLPGVRGFHIPEMSKEILSARTILKTCIQCQSHHFT